MFGRKKTIRISDISYDSGEGTRRVSASVNGRDLWFSSPNAALRPSAEAFAGAMLLPALHAGADIVVEAPLDPAWARNARRYLEIFGRLLNLPDVDIRSPPAEARRRGPWRKDRHMLLRRGGLVLYAPQRAV